MMIKRLAQLITFATCFGILAAPVSAETPLAITIHPDMVTIGAAYNGADVVISGGVEEDAEVLVRLLGKENNEKFKVKGKTLGFLWMNMETIELSHVPTMMLLLPSPDLADKIKNKPDEWQRLGLGFETLKRDITVSPDGRNKEMLVGELMKLKQRQGLYGIQEDALSYTEDGAQKAFSVVAHLPSSLAPGNYRIEVYAVRDGRVLAESTRTIEAREVGMPAFLTSIAFNHSLLYGVMAVMIAICAGILIGYIFKGGRGAH